MKESKWIWNNGKFVLWKNATTHVMSHGLHYGTGVFEGIRAYSGSVFRMQNHYKRFFNSAKVAGIKIPYSKANLEARTLELLYKNGLKDCYIRPLAFIGEGSIGINPGSNKINVIIAAFEWGTYLGKDAMSKGIRMKISSFKRMSVNSFMTKSKICGNYINSVLAKREALEQGYDEALLLDDNTEFNSKPELEIYADDVKCSHGSSSGNIDDDALHYLMTRGLSRKDSTKLLIKGFLSEVLEFVKNPKIKKFIESTLEKQINEN